MSKPADLRYTKEHEWTRIEDPHLGAEVRTKARLVGFVVPAAPVTGASEREDIE